MPAPPWSATIGSRRRILLASPSSNKIRSRTLQFLGVIHVLAGILMFWLIPFGMRVLDDSAVDPVDHPTLAQQQEDHLENLSPRNSPPKATKIVFVHPGKTGGTTVGSMLRVLCEGRTKEDSRKHCLQEWKDRHMTNTFSILPESQLSQSTQGFFHVTGIYPPNILSEATHFLVSLRNPMERVVSWFYYLHPQNCFQMQGIPTPRANFTLIDKACITKRRIDKTATSLEAQFYQDCFPTVHEFAQALSSVDDTTKCHKLALQTLQGQGGPNGFAGHLWANYSYYAQKTLYKYPQTVILGVRTEALWDDLRQIDQYLGGTGQVFHWQKIDQYLGGTGEVLQRQKHQESDDKSQQYYHKDKLSPQSYFSLCCALQKELLVYQDFVQAAVNLPETETLEPVYQRCGPNIHSIQELNRACRKQHQFAKQDNQR